MYTHLSREQFEGSRYSFQETTEEVVRRKKKWKHHSHSVLCGAVNLYRIWLIRVSHLLVCSLASCQDAFDYCVKPNARPATATTPVAAAAAPVGLDFCVGHGAR